jgi:hypothetical protein
MPEYYLEGSRVDQGLNFLVEQLGALSRVSQTLSLLVLYSLVIAADGANLLKVATTILSALEDTSIGKLESAVGTDMNEVGGLSPYFTI